MDCSDAGQQLRTATRDEHARADDQSAAREQHPAKDRLEGLTGKPSLDEALEVVVAAAQQEGGLLLGEHATGRPEPGDELVGGQARPTWKAATDAEAMSRSDQSPANRNTVSAHAG